MEKPPGMERTWAAVDESTYYREQEQRLHLDELAVGDNLVFRQKSHQDDPFAWDIYSQLTAVRYYGRRDLYRISFDMFVSDEASPARYWMQEDGMVVNLERNGKHEEAGYFLGSLQRFDDELTEALARAEPRRPSLAGRLHGSH